MKTYSVKQIAEMLNTNPETVRRWIRDKKLHAVQVSRKDGNVITDDELQRFLKATPKYAPRFTASIAGSMVAMPVVGLPLAIAALLGSKAAGYIDETKQLDLRVLPEDVVEYLNKSIVEHEISINQKKASIVQIQKEIEKEQNELEQLKYLLRNGDFNKVTKPTND